MIDTQSIEEEVSFALEVINSSLIGRHITPVWAFVATWVGMTHPSTHAGNNVRWHMFAYAPYECVNVCMVFSVCVCVCVCVLHYMIMYFPLNVL